MGRKREGMAGEVVREGAQRNEVSRAGAVVLAVALSLSFVSTWLLNAVGYPPIDDICPAARYIAPLAGAIVAFACALASQDWPAVFTTRSAMLLTLVVLVASTAGIYVADALGSAVLAAVAASIRWIACVMRDIILGFALLSLSARRCLRVLAGGYFLRYVWILGLGFLPFEGKVVLFFLCAPVGLLMLWPFARPALGTVATLDTPANLQITNPLSFLPLTNRMFAIVVLFSMALGFSTTLGSGGSGVVGGVAAVVLFAVLFGLLVLRRAALVDALYGVSYLLVLGGTLLVPGLGGGVGGSTTFLCNVLCESGSSLFSLAVWYLGATVGARNLAGMLPFLFMVRAARGLGTAIGVGTGELANYLVVEHVGYVSFLIAVIVFGFAAYNFVFVRAFSFDATAAGVRPLEGAAVPSPAPEAAVPTIDAACEAVATGHCLTARELDVLRLLAKGRNAAYIQAELALTRNTAKSYVADVYRKLGVHSHQELIDLVEAAR